MAFSETGFIAVLYFTSREVPGPTKTFRAQVNLICLMVFPAKQETRL